MNSASDQFFGRLFPEMPAGGFNRYDQRVIFYTRVNSLLTSDMTVVDFGAGRGFWSEVEEGYKRQLTHLKGRCRKLIGLDLDPVVLENANLDEAHVLEAGKAYPLDDDSVDLMTSWAVLEHVADPEDTAREIERVLRAGGWLCAWTPNKWGYIGIGARAIPNRFHGRLLKVINPQMSRKDADVFPVAYKLNTVGALKKHFPKERFNHHSYVGVGQPGYSFGSTLVARIWLFYNRIVPEFLGQSLFVFIQKRTETSRDV